MKKPFVLRWVGLYSGLFISFLFGLHSAQGATLMWDPNPPSENVTRYTVYVISPSGTNQTDVPVPGFPLDSLTKGVVYTLNVTATSDLGESFPSSISYFVPLPPTITTPPASKTVAVGDLLQLTVDVGGSPPFSFRWMRNGSNIAGQTNQTLSISSATTGSAGNYTVAVTNAAGSVVSAAATVTVLTRPTITTQPVARTIAEGSALNLSVVATGSAPLSYQWFRNGQAISGAQSASYQVAAATSANAGNYFVQVTNLVGLVQSSTVAVTVQQPPVITSQPQSISVSQGSQLALSVNATGSAPLSYQWYKNGAILAGRTSAFLIVATVSEGDAGNYTVRVTNPYGFTDSSQATVTVQTSSTAPIIVKQPQPATVAAGSILTLDVLASGTAPLSYYWFKDGVELADMDSILIRGSAALVDAGIYSVIVSNSVGTATSAPVSVAILLGPAIQTQPLGANIPLGGTAILSVSATGTNPLNYQWYRNDQLIAGATSSTLTIGPADSDDDGSYVVVVSNAGGSITSAPAFVTVTQDTATPPRIVTQPQPLQLTEGASGEIAIEADGQRPLQFLWFKNGQTLPNETNSVLSFTSAKVSDAGTYVVQIFNRFGAIGSDPVVVTVQAVPHIIWQPESVSVPAGNSFQFSVGATSSEPLTYQWYKDDVAIAGATSSNYRVTVAQASHAGTYRVKVSNSTTFIMSAPATFTVAVPPVITQQPTNATVNEGSTLRLSFQATGTGPFLVEWFRENSLTRVTNTTEYVVGSCAPTDSGRYSARVTGPGGSASTAAATVQVQAKPVINLQPEGADVQFGQVLTLTVSATGNGTLSYQWFKNGKIIDGAQNIFLIVAVRTESDLGQYTVRVSNSAGFTESEPAIIQKLSPPTITLQPASIDLLEGGPLFLTVAAGGTAPLAYQWFKDGAPVSGANSPALSIAAAGRADSGSYRVTITNSQGSIQSSVANVKVVPHLVLSQNLSDKTVALGSELRLSVIATSDLTLSYQWFHNGLELEGEGQSVLIIPKVANSDAGLYHVIVQNTLEQVTSADARVTVEGPDTSAGVLNIAASRTGITLSGQGSPGATYDVQLTGDLTNPNWITIQSVTADANGQFDIRAPSSGRAWYIRTLKH